MAAGRPTKYKPSFNRQAEKLCKLGATDKELADFFNVNEDSIHTWKKKYPKFSESLNAGKILADMNVANKLYTRAIGYKVREVTFEKIDSKENIEATPEGLIVKGDVYRKKIVVKEQAPDTTAQIFWLKNRRGKVKDEGGHRWADKQEVTGEGGGPLQGLFEITLNIQK